MDPAQRICYRRLHCLGLLMLANKTYAIDHALRFQHSFDLQESLFFAEVNIFVTCADGKLCIKHCLVNVPGQCSQSRLLN